MSHTKNAIDSFFYDNDDDDDAADDQWKQQKEKQDTNKSNEWILRKNKT